MPGLQSNPETLNSPEHKALQTLLSGEADISETTNNFCSPTESKFAQTQDPSDVEALLWRAWQALTTAAAQTAHTSSQRNTLADLVLQVQVRSDLEQNGKVCRVWDETVWQGLPILGPQMREAWNFAATSSSPKDEQTAWLNLNAFLATLISSLHGSGSKADFSLFGLWTLRTALEEQESPDPVSLQAAAMWVKHAAPVLRKFSSEGKKFDGKVAKPGGLFKEESWRGFEDGRWKLWQQRFKESKGGDEIVDKAIQAMSKSSS